MSRAVSDFNLVDTTGWEYELQSVYSAYMGHFQLHNIPWYEKSWAPLFESFDEFLGFSWPVMVVTDSWTKKGHIVTKMSHIHTFLKMIKTRFGETLSLVDNFLKISPFESSPRPVRTIVDLTSYRKLHATITGVVLTSLKARVRSGEPDSITELWNSKDKTFLAIDFEWSERNTSSCLEWGYAAVRCSHLNALGVWPPDPEANYRRGHYIVSEYIDKVQNKHSRNFPWDYTFGESQVVLKARLPLIIQAVISSLSSPDSDNTPNDLVLVAHGISGDLQRLTEMKIKIPHNMLVIDTAIFEKQLFSIGHRGPMVDPQTGKVRATKTMISLAATFRSFGVDVQCAFHNSGNDAFLCLLAMQLLLDKDNTRVPKLTAKSTDRNMLRPGSLSPTSQMSMPVAPQFPVMAPVLAPKMMPTPSVSPPLVSVYSMGAYLDNDFGVTRRTPGHPNGSMRRGKSTGDKNQQYRKSMMDDLTGSMKNL